MIHRTEKSANHVVAFVTTDSQNWEQLQRLFHLAAEAPEGQREQVLADACPDADLRQRVVAILTASGVEPEPEAEQNQEMTGRIGPYRLLRHLGTGGIGSVYLVERMVGGSPHRSALKVLARHAAGPLFVERFHREQHILASLDHPNITRMVDAGLSEDGQPYLVMEYVNGSHLDAHCNARQLTLDQRLNLFLQVCDAVAYAHRNLIVHLDLKPSNILVTEDGVVKLLDFGTSKLIEPDSLLTTTILATPAYASPEQLRNEPVTTACDVYSLGAILFELLSGRRPGGKASVAAMVERAVREQEPEPLTDAVLDEAAARLATTTLRLRQALRGDLATITSKCLRARPLERYLSVDALAEDVRRYLAGRPVLATRQTLLYLSGKFVRRHWKAVTVSAAAVLVLVGTISYAVVRQEQALRNARRAVQMQAFMVRVFKLANTNVMGKPAATVPEFLRLWSTVLPQLIKDPADQRAGQLSLAESMFFDGDYKDAAALFEQVISRAKAEGDIAAEAEAEAYAGMVAYKVGNIAEFNAFSSRSLQLVDKQEVTPAVRVWIRTFHSYARYELGYVTPEDVAIQRLAYKEAHDSSVPADELAYAANVLSLVLYKAGVSGEQLKLAQEAVSIYQREPYGFCEAANAEQSLALMLNNTNDQQKAYATMRESYESFKQCRGEDNFDTLVAESGLGWAEFVTGKTRDSIATLNDAVNRIDRTQGPESMALVAPLSFLGRTYIAVAQYDKAEESAVRLVKVLTGKVNPRSAQLGMAHWIWAQALAGQGRMGDALIHARMADDLYQSEGGKTPGVLHNAKLIHDLVNQLQAKVNRTR